MKREIYVILLLFLSVYFYFFSILDQTQLWLPFTFPSLLYVKHYLPCMNCDNIDNLMSLEIDSLLICTGNCQCYVLLFNLLLCLDFWRKKRTSSLFPAVLQILKHFCSFLFLWNVRLFYSSFLFLMTYRHDST